MMTGIIIAGRTGAAFAAQLGTMQVNEEIDALATFGFEPMEFLVLPRMLALVLMMPLLCLYADLMGILGGAFVGVMFLDLPPITYFQATQDGVPPDRLRGRRCSRPRSTGSWSRSPAACAACSAGAARPRSARPPPRRWSPRSSSSWCRWRF